MQIDKQELEELQAIANSFIKKEGDEIASVDWTFLDNEYYPYREQVLKYLIHVGVLSILRDGNYALQDNDGSNMNPLYRVNTCYFTKESYAADYKKDCFSNCDFPVSLIKIISTD